MSGIHVLTGGVTVYTVVIHIATPVGNNSAGILWSDAVKNAGLNTTIMTVGLGPGQITSSEAALITAGTLLEGSFVWQDTPTWTNAQRIADLDTRATQLSNDLLALRGDQLKYFGFVR